MGIIRNDTGEVRSVWKVILIILLFLAVEVLLRFIPISLLTAYLTRSGLTHTNALESSTTLVYEHPVYSTVIGILVGFMGLLIVWFLVRVVEKSNFTWKTVGLDWKRNSPLVILLGAVLAVLLFFASILTGSALSPTGFSLIFPSMGVSAQVFFQNFILFLGMGFGEEIVFRGYVQTRLVERYRAFWGILITAIVFVLLHQISYGLSPVIILSGVMLWVSIGVLYYLSKSLYLVVIMHGLMNTLLNTLLFEVSEISTMIVHALALLLVVVVVGFLRSRGSGIRQYPI